MKREILGVALAGGRSSRMGQDKSALEIREGVTQLDYALELLESYCLERAVSCRTDQVAKRGSKREVRCIEDAPGIKGPMAGVIASLRAAEGWPVLLIACDMPYLDASVLLSLISRRDALKCGTCFLATDGKPDPMCAIYEPASLALLERRVREQAFSLRRFLGEEDVERITLERPSALASVNTPEEAKAARKSLSLE